MWFAGGDADRHAVVTRLTSLLDEVGPASSEWDDPAPSRRAQLRDLDRLRACERQSATVYLRGGWQIVASRWGEPAAMYHGPTVEIRAHFADDSDVERQAGSAFREMCRSLHPLQGAMRSQHGRSLLAFDYVFPRGSAMFVRLSPEVYARFVALIAMDDYWLGDRLAHRAGLAHEGFISELAGDDRERALVLSALSAASEQDLAPYVLLDERPRGPGQ